MKYFLHICKSVVYASVQINKAVATYLRGGKKTGVIRARGMQLDSRGFGWYRIYGDAAAKGSDILSTVNFLCVRVNNMLRPKLSIPAPKDDLFAYEQGFFKQDILRKSRRTLKVKYEQVNGRRVPKIVNRAIQASQGLRDFMSDTLSRLVGSTLTESKLEALVHKFSH